ncbi:MAG: short-chain dehydrogenase, partial [Gammaproteobacteria bacterium]
MISHPVKEVLDELAQELETQYGVSTRTVRADLSDPESIPAIDRATQDIEIGLLVSNAGTGS